MTDVFSDQSHIDRVRDALWRRSTRASVMIGAGFSKYADKARPGVGEPPLWRDLAMELSIRLPPHSLSTKSAGPAVAEDFLRQAQEFKDTFGDSELYQLLEDLIRDVDYQPGELHLRLLQLPWRDVFTTNWDTSGAR